MLVSPRLLEVTTTVSTSIPRVARVVVAGEIDAGTVPLLHAALERAGADEPTWLEIDLAQVTFFSCAGIGALLRAHNRRSGRFTVTAVSPPVLRILNIVPLGRSFGLE